MRDSRKNSGTSIGDRKKHAIFDHDVVITSIRNMKIDVT